MTSLYFLLQAEVLNDRQPDHIPAANRLLLVIDNYGGKDITRYDFNKETAHLTNLTISLMEKPEDIALLNISDDIAYIKATNEDFRTLYKDRGDTIWEN